MAGQCYLLQVEDFISKSKSLEGFTGIKPLESCPSYLDLSQPGGSLLELSTLHRWHSITMAMTIYPLGVVDSRFLGYCVGY